MVNGDAYVAARSLKFEATWSRKPASLKNSLSHIPTTGEPAITNRPTVIDSIDRLKSARISFTHAFCPSELSNYVGAALLRNASYELVAASCAHFLVITAY